MRKLLNIIALSTVVLVSSCDMDQMPVGNIDPDKAFETTAQLEYQTNGIYARLRDNYITPAVIAADIQADYVNGVIGFTNTYGDFYKWSFTQQDTDIATVWQKCYFTIAQCNLVLGKTENFESESTGSDVILAKARGAAHLARAMSYSMLADRFCEAYKPETAQTAYSGVPLIKVYDPSFRMPDRATLYDVYEFILKDIEEARTYFEEVDVKGSASATTFNIDCVEAIAARVYLNMGNYEEAYKKAKLLIDNPTYALAADQNEFDAIWDFDKGKEIIFKFYASKTELPDAYGSLLFNDAYSGVGRNQGKPAYQWSADFLPTQELLDKIKDEDYRSHWVFNGRGENAVELYTLGQFIVEPLDGNNVPYKMLMKFSGNEELLTASTWNYCNAWKPIRLAEMYLIAAEAGLQAPGGDAKTPLNTLRKHRGLAELPTVALNDVKAERYLELMLEGFRISDLKRWGDPMKHGEAQQAILLKPGPSDGSGNITSTIEANDSLDRYLSIQIARELIAQPEDFRFVWPIPAAEIYANQNLAGQQNKGWGN